MIIVKVPSFDFERCPAFNYPRFHNPVIMADEKDFDESLLKDPERLKSYQVKCDLCEKKYDFDGKVANAVVL